MTPTPRRGQRARREPLQHLPPGRAIRAGRAGLPHLRLPATNIPGRRWLSGGRSGGCGRGCGQHERSRALPAPAAARAFKGWLAFLGARRANQRRRGRKREAGAGGSAARDNFPQGRDGAAAGPAAPRWPGSGRQRRLGAPRELVQRLSGGARWPPSGPALSPSPAAAGSRGEAVRGPGPPNPR